MENYNCRGSIDSSYGAGAYNTCTATVGVPNTGFQTVMTSGSFIILLPLAALILVTVVAMIVGRYKKTHAK